MDLSKKDVWFLAKALCLSILLPVAAIGSLAFLVDWDGPLDEMPPAERAKLEDCAVAERVHGPDLDKARPDCRAVIEPTRAMAANVTAH